MQNIEQKSTQRFFSSPFLIISLILSLALIIYFYGYVSDFGTKDGSGNYITIWQTAVYYWTTPMMEIMHGWICFPFLAFVLYSRRTELTQASKQTDLWGLLPIFLGLALFLIGWRTIQTRLNMFAFPLFLLGIGWFLWGKNVAKLIAAPLLLILMAIPIPTIQQSTYQLQILASDLAYMICNICHVPTELCGTSIISLSGKWDSYEIVGGCSGIRSLTTLIMISSTWAFAAPITLWKKFIIFISAVPLAILANGLRVGSIMVLAEYVNPKFASATWHDWAGLIIFFPLTLMALYFIQAALTGELPLLKRHKRSVVTIQHNQK